MTILPMSGPARSLGPAGRVPVKARGGFGVAAPVDLPDVAGAGVAATEAVPAPPGMDLLLGAQETGAETVRDRAARRHGQESLKLLRALQAALLGDAAWQAGTGGSAHETGLESAIRLAGHLARVPVAEDPRLAEVQRAITLRVAVELARRGVALEPLPKQ